jgi:hypothetical protein
MQILESLGFLPGHHVVCTADQQRCPRSATFCAASGKVGVVANVDAETQALNLEGWTFVSCLEHPFAAKEVRFPVSTDQDAALDDDRYVEQPSAVDFYEAHYDHRSGFRHPFQDGIELR